LKNKLKYRKDIKVISAGTSSFAGAKVSPETVEVMAREGIDVSEHLTKSITEDIIKESNIILVMERRHRDIILKRVPEAKNKIHLLTEYGRPKQEVELVNPDIPDPIGKPIETHQECLNIIKEGVDRVARQLAKNK